MKMRRELKKSVYKYRESRNDIEKIEYGWLKKREMRERVKDGGKNIIMRVGALLTRAS